MNVSVVDIIVWVLVGMLAGSLAGMVVRRRKKGYGPWINLAIGMVGALIGGFLFDLLGIDLGLANISISLQDLVAAFTGSLLFLALLFYGRGWYRKSRS